MYPKRIPSASEIVSNIDSGYCFENNHNYWMENRLREYREKAGLSQEAAGKIIGHQKAAMQKLENKSVDQLKIGDLFKLAAAYKCTAWDLVGEDVPSNAKIISDIKAMQQQMESLTDNVIAMTAPATGHKDTEDVSCD